MRVLTGSTFTRMVCMWMSPSEEGDMPEKFMKGFAKVALDKEFSQKEIRAFSHDISKCHDAIAAEIRGMNLMNLLADIECGSAVRYGEEVSTKHQAYQAHKSSLLLIRTLGAVRYSQSTG